MTLKQARKKAEGITQKELADRLGIAWYEIDYTAR